MRAFVALMGSAVALLVGMVTLQTAQDQTTINGTGANQTAADLLEAVSVDLIDPLASHIAILAVMVLVLLAAGVLVAAARGR